MDFKSQRPEFECSRCGRCCEVLSNSIEWVGGDLTWDEKQTLLAERAKHPANDKGCKMLYYDNGLAVCLVTEFFEGKRRDINCINYPKNSLCVREEIETGIRLDIFPFEYKIDAERKDAK